MTARIYTFIISILLLLLATGINAQPLQRSPIYVISNISSDTIHFAERKTTVAKLKLPAERDVLRLSRVETITTYDARGTIVNKQQTDLIGFDGLAPGTYNVVIGKGKGYRLVVEVN